MMRAVATTLAFLFMGTTAFSQGLDSYYKLGPDSLEQEGVPHGPTEYNTPDDKYAREICDELLPVLYKEYNLFKDPEQHGFHAGPAP